LHLDPVWRNNQPQVDFLSVKYTLFRSQVNSGLIGGPYDLPNVLNILFLSITTNKQPINNHTNPTPRYESKHHATNPSTKPGQVIERLSTGAWAWAVVLWRCVVVARPPLAAP